MQPSFWFCLLPVRVMYKYHGHILILGYYRTIASFLFWWHGSRLSRGSKGCLLFLWYGIKIAFKPHLSSTCLRCPRILIVVSRLLSRFSLSTCKVTWNETEAKKVVYKCELHTGCVWLCSILFISKKHETWRCMIQIRG